MIELPDSPAPANVTPGLLYFGSSITPPLGGPTQTIERLGTRHKLKVTMPPLPNKDAAMAYLSKLRRGKSGGVRMAWPLGGFDPGDPGPAPAIRIERQIGKSFTLQGMRPGYIIKEGQFFSIESDGVHYLYEATEDREVLPTGNAEAFGCHPLIRATHSVGDTVHFVRPMIEGILIGQDLDWELSVEYLNEFEFEIHERK